MFTVQDFGGLPAHPSISKTPRAPTRIHPRAPHPYTYMRTYVHHEFGLTGEGGRAVEPRGGGVGQILHLLTVRDQKVTSKQKQKLQLSKKNYN